MVNKQVREHVQTDAWVTKTTHNVKNKGVVHHLSLYTQKNPIRSYCSKHRCLCKSCFTSSHLQGSHWITGYGKWYWLQSTDDINPLQVITLMSHFYSHGRTVCACVNNCVFFLYDRAWRVHVYPHVVQHTLCAGTRLTNTVSNSSCDTVSPSQMMELIRSTICMCTFWLWPLLKGNGKQSKKGQRSAKASWQDLKCIIQHRFRWYKYC